MYLFEFAQGRKKVHSPVKPSKFLTLYYVCVYYVYQHYEIITIYPKCFYDCTAYLMFMRVYNLACFYFNWFRGVMKNRFSFIFLLVPIKNSYKKYTIE